MRVFEAMVGPDPADPLTQLLHNVGTRLWPGRCLPGSWWGVTLWAAMLWWAALGLHLDWGHMIWLLQVSLPENYTQFLDAAGLVGARIGVFRQIRSVGATG